MPTLRDVTSARPTAEEPTRPGKPGWYWDPWELPHNLELRDRWRRQVIITGPDNFLLRRWDGQMWTSETLGDYQLVRGGMPHFFGPTTRIRPLTPEQGARNLKIWAVLMALSCLGWVAAMLLG